MQGTRAVELAETGMEEALWALNKNDWSTWTTSGTTATKTISGFSFDAGATGVINLTVTNYNGSLVGVTRTVTAKGTTTQADGKVVSRTLSSTSAKAPLFVNAIFAASVGTANGRVKFKSAGTVDSYDSSLGLYSSQTPGYSAVVGSAATNTSSATVQLTRAQIKGYVSTLSTGPSYSSGAKIIGPTSGTTSIDTDRISTSPYQPLFDEVIPTGAGTTWDPSTMTTIGTAGATSEKLYYYYGNVNLGGSYTLTVNGPVVLVVTGDFFLSTSAMVRITTTGSFRLHVASDLAINGNGIQNDTKLPKKCIIINTTIYDTYQMSTTTDFYGVIYAPASGITISKDQEIYGAIVAESVTFSRSPTFHYDLDLRRTVFNGFDTPFAAADVRESY